MQTLKDSTGEHKERQKKLGESGRQRGEKKKKKGRQPTAWESQLEGHVVQGTATGTTIKDNSKTG